MALRSKAETAALIIAFTFAASAQPLSFQVRHRHLRNGTVGVLRVDGDAISFESRQWQIAQIQQLTLSPQTLRILTYEDRGLIGQDREFVFDRLPAGAAAELYTLLSSRMDQRFIAAMPDPLVTPVWQIPVKLLHRTHGSNGTLVVGAGAIVYRTEAPQESRTWRIRDIENVASGGPFDLTISTLESGGKDFRFQLKEALPEARYNGLWRTIQKSKGVDIP